MLHQFLEVRFGGGILFSEASNAGDVAQATGFFDCTGEIDQLYFQFMNNVFDFNQPLSTHQGIEARLALPFWLGR